MVIYPKDWNEKSFSDFIKIKRGASPRPIEKYLTSSTYGVNWIKIGDAPRYGKYIASTKEKITPQGAASSVRVFSGDFILSNSMSFGRPYILSIDGCIHDGWLRLYGFQTEANDEFLYYLLSSSYVQKQYEAFAAGSGVQNLNKEVVKKVSVFLPPLPEQEEIAQTLSQFDTYIDNLTELIEKKKAIRDGAIEDLTSGRTRLDGFDDEWVVYPFDQYFTLLPTNTYSREQLSNRGKVGNIHYGDVLIRYGNVLTDDDEIPRLKDSSKVDERSYLQMNDVLIADTAEDETVGKAVQIGNVSIPLVGGLHTVACRPNYETAEGFLGYYMNSSHYHDQLYPYITGIKVSSVSKKSFGKTYLRIPADSNEQKAISSVLTEMDNEITDLEAERDKMIQIREGVMDDLLTGRVRLTV
ncbi:MAG: hypothetical protein GX783_01120 [Clostridiales bacterium]|nr:hypothetical protein [Clostridiales bacterium]